MTTEYYTNAEYNVKLYDQDGKYILERNHEVTGELLQVVFNSKLQADGFLRGRKYELYRIIYE